MARLTHPSHCAWKGLALLALCALCSSPYLHAQQLATVSDARISPDGSVVAYTRNDKEIVIVNATSGAVVNSFPGSQPRWSFDGRRLAYLNGKGLWINDAAAPGPRFLTAWEAPANDTENYAWSPDGNTIAFIRRDGPEVGQQRHTHIWTVPASGGEAKILTPGLHDEHTLAWSPDGRRIAFVSRRGSDPQNTATHIFVAEFPSGVTIQLTRTSGSEDHPAYAADGAWIAYLSQDGKLWIAPAQPGSVTQPRMISGSLDRRIVDFTWHSDSRSIYCVAQDQGATAIYRIGIERGTVENITSTTATAPQFSLDAKGLRMAWVQNDLTHLTEVWANDGRITRQVSHENDAIAKATIGQGMEMFSFPAADGVKVQAWLMKPAKFDATRKYPMVLCVPDGPHGKFGFAYSPRLQALTSLGYGVLLINPRGSTGYGQKFAESGPWGGAAYKDLSAGVDYALSHYTWTDPQKLAVIGGYASSGDSRYGGYMAEWMITQSNRFKAAIAISGASDLVSLYGTSPLADFIDAEFGGPSTDNWQPLWQASPLSGVKSVSTPLLLLHGEADKDVPISQSEELYNALHRAGKVATLVRYPGEGHALSGAEIDKQVADWLTQYLK